MTSLFMTATGTDIGKTYLTAALIKALRARGRKVSALKPIISGFDPEQPEASDSGALLAALGRELTAHEIEQISPWRFRAPLSPDMAAQREGITLELDDIVRFCQTAMGGQTGITLIEGVGGVMVPLNHRETVLDWMERLRLPVILVTGSYLGTLSHTLTALDALARRGLSVRSIIVNQTPGSTVALADTVETLGRFANDISVCPFTHQPASGPGLPDCQALAQACGLTTFE